MTRNRYAIVFFLLMLFQVSGAQAQEADAPASPTFGMELGLGTETLPKDPVAPEGTSNLATYQKLALNPDLGFGKFGVGLDVSVHFNIRPGSNANAFELYEPDWVPSKAGKSFLELYLPKISYVRWGTKGDPLYVKLGSIEDGTLGNGFIMGNYSNTSFLPAARMFGASLDVDGSLFKFPYLGFETFIGNLANFDVIGSRIYARPLLALALPILKNIQVGTTIAADIDPHRYAPPGLPKADSLQIFGLDARLPIFSNPAASLSVFADAAFQPRGRWGTMAGAGGKFFGWLDYGAQLRILGPQFIPTYFDSPYDLFRVEKHKMLSKEPAGSVSVGYLAQLGFSLLSDAVSFKLALDGPFKAAPTDIAQAGIADYPHLRGTLGLAEGVLAGFSIEGIYEKFYLGAPAAFKGTGNFFKDLVSPENALIGAKFNYRTGPAVISLLYNVRYSPESGDYIVTSSLLSSVRF
jgi:hypothetical protein